MEVWNKFNPRERMIGLGALIVGAGWILSLVGSFGFGSNTITLVGAIAALVVLYLKYAPNQNITWPAPIPLILLAISGITGLLAAISLLQWLSLMGAFASLFGVALISVIVTAVGAALMVWGSWQEYQLAPKTAGTTSAAPEQTSSAPPAEQTSSAPPAAQPPAAPPYVPPAEAPSAPPPATPPPAPIVRPDEDDRPPV